MTAPVQQRNGYSYRLVNIDCLRGATSFNVLMDLDRPVAHLMPFLAAILNGCRYVHGTDEICLMDDGHIVVFYPQRLTLTDVKDLAEAEALCLKYHHVLQDVEARRDRIQPVFSKKNRTTVLDILKGLPKTNCGECGDPTCLAFASRVYRREAPLARCPRLAPTTPACSELIAALRADGYDLPDGSP